MLVVERNEKFVHWSIGDIVHPMEYGGEVVVVFDPSKTNMAMVVGTPDGTILNTIEFSGNNRKKGPAMDTTLYCEELRKFLAVYLSKVKLYLVGVEQAITKQGTSYHHSNMVLTEIRSNILNFFLEEFGMHVVEVNNWSWKYAILPEGFRSKYEKGSKKYFTKYLSDSPYAHYFEADMTDCICIYWYLVKKECSNYTVYCNRYEDSLNDYQYCYVSVTSKITEDMREVTYNPRFDIETNLNYYANRVVGAFFMLVDISSIDISTVYGHSVGFLSTDLESSKVKVVVTKRC